MERKLIITKFKEHMMSMLYEDGKMAQAEVIAMEGDTDSFLGNIYVARVENVVKNINAAFVEISKGVKCYYSLTSNEKHIFLNRKNNDKVNIGDLLLVQVERDAVKTKMAVAGCNINIGGRYVAVTLDGRVNVSLKIDNEERRSELVSLLEPLVTPKLGFVVRTGATEALNEDILEEATKLKALMEQILAYAKHRVAFTCMYRKENGYSRILTDVGIDSLSEIVTDEKEICDDLTGYLTKEFPDKVNMVRFYEDKLLPLSKLYSVESAIEGALKKRVWLKSGGYLVIEPTEALTVIDVNTGKVEGKKNREETFLKVNLEAAKEIAYQIRLRNYSGIIIADFIDMEKDDNKRLLMDTLKEAIRYDTVKTNIVDITKLGLVEMTRKKVKRPLHEQVEFLLRKGDKDE